MKSSKLMVNHLRRPGGPSLCDPSNSCGDIQAETIDALILWGPSMSLQHPVPVPPKHVEMFPSGPKLWRTSASTLFIYLCFHFGLV